MKTKDFITKNVDSSGTSLQGYCRTTRTQIEEAFGTPSYENADLYEKVTTEWTIQFSDGKVATIYDWKRYNEGAPEMNETYDWHIGGHSSDILQKVSGILGTAVYVA